MNSSEDHIERARLLIRLRRPDQAEAVLRQALAAETSNAYTKVLLVQSLYDQDRVQDALDVANQAVAEAPNWSHSHVAKGRLLWFAGQHEAAEASLLEGIRLEPDFPPYLVSLADFYNDQRRWHEAGPLAARALEIDAHDVSALVSAAVAAANTGKLERSLALLADALAEDPEHINANYLKARVLKYQGRCKEAAALTQNALRMNPSLEGAPKQLANVEREARKGIAYPEIAWEQVFGVGYLLFVIFGCVVYFVHQNWPGVFDGWDPPSREQVWVGEFKTEQGPVPLTLHLGKSEGRIQIGKAQLHFDRTKDFWVFNDLPTAMGGRSAWPTKVKMQHRGKDSLHVSGLMFLPDLELTRKLDGAEPGNSEVPESP